MFTYVLHLMQVKMFIFTSYKLVSEGYLLYICLKSFSDVSKKNAGSKAKMSQTHGSSRDIIALVFIQF